MRVVQVLPQGVGWSVHGCGEPIYFHSGPRAEAAARQLAAALAETSSVELRVADRSGRLAGRLRLGAGVAVGRALEVV